MSGLTLLLKKWRNKMAEYYYSEEKEVSVAQYDISVIPNDFNVLTINSLLEKNVISMPSFQRNYVWDRKRASKFIESLIIGLPVPQIFLYQLDRNKYSVIDGQQRLMSIYFFIKQRFPKPGKRTFLRKIFNKDGRIPDEILADDDYFQDFKLQFAKLENGRPHRLNGKKYTMLDEAQRGSFELMPIRCMSVRQNKPDDNASMYEIFNRLNTGGLNLSSQEIRGCLYNSAFYDQLYKLNTDRRWRKLLGKTEEDDKFKDVEIILRSFALLFNHDQYTGAMIQFLNKFSKEAQQFDDKKISQCVGLFDKFLGAVEEIDTAVYLTKNNSFNVSFFDSIFVAVGEHLLVSAEDKISISQDAFEKLKKDADFYEAITHSTSHVQSVKTRLRLARRYLFGENEDGK